MTEMFERYKCALLHDSADPKLAWFAKIELRLMAHNQCDRNTNFVNQEKSSSEKYDIYEEEPMKKKMNKLSPADAMAVSGGVNGNDGGCTPNPFGKIKIPGQS